MVWLIYSDEELLAAKRNRLAVNRTFSGRRSDGCLSFFRVGQGDVVESKKRLRRRQTTAGKIICRITLDQIRNITRRKHLP